MTDRTDEARIGGTADPSAGATQDDSDEETEELNDSVKPEGSQRNGSQQGGSTSRDPRSDLPSLEELTLPERLLVAAVQDPVRGFAVVVLSLFAVSFLVALAFVYPAVALAFFLLLAAAGLAFVGYAAWQLRNRRRK
ncbi:MAG: hypothetical protein V5A46_07650 [Haloferacaceae archaeon]